MHWFEGSCSEHRPLPAYQQLLRYWLWPITSLHHVPLVCHPLPTWFITSRIVLSSKPFITVRSSSHRYENLSYISLRMSGYAQSVCEWGVCVTWEPLSRTGSILRNISERTVHRMIFSRDTYKVVSFVLIINWKQRITWIMNGWRRT